MLQDLLNDSYKPFWVSISLANYTLASGQYATGKPAIYKLATNQAAQITSNNIVYNFSH